MFSGTPWDAGATVAQDDYTPFPWVADAPAERSDTARTGDFSAETLVFRSVKLTRSEIEWVDAPSETSPALGIRFRDVAIPANATILGASLQFSLGEFNSPSGVLDIRGIRSANAAQFCVSQQETPSKTTAGVSWVPAARNVNEGSASGQETSDLSSIVGEITGLSGWAAGNSLAFLVSGARQWTSAAYAGQASQAPQLRVDYLVPDQDARTSIAAPVPMSEPSSGSGATSHPPAPILADTFACLNTASDIVVVEGTNQTERYEVDAAMDRAFDARTASFLISNTTHGIIQVEGDETEAGMCWAGGYVEGDKPWDASWDDWKNDPATRNSAVITNRAYSATVTGIHFFNVHDGTRISDADDWTVQHVWGEYVRDDCVENDNLHGGQIVDSLFDGCYAGISTRPSQSDTTSDGTGQVVTLDRVLLAIEASPYPFEWETKPGNLDENGDPWNGTGIPYGHGRLFKYEEGDLDRNVHFVIKDSVFLLPHDNVPADKLNFPPEELIDEFSNVTIVWLGTGDYPGSLPTDKFPDSVTILTGPAGQLFWNEQAKDWHERHPDVDPARKPPTWEISHFPGQLSSSGVELSFFPGVVKQNP